MANKAGLIAAFTGLADNYEIKAGEDYFKLGNIKRELGIELQQKQYETRLLALTDPKAYSDERKLMVDQMTAELGLVYQQAFAEYSGSGLPFEVAKQYALKSAAAKRDEKMQLIELNFPSGANAIGSASLEYRTKPRGLLSTRRAPAPRRAPARRRRR
jgi:hypothetical protein